MRGYTVLLSVPDPIILLEILTGKLSINKVRNLTGGIATILGAIQMLVHSFSIISAYSYRGKIKQVALPPLFFLHHFVFCFIFLEPF